MSENVFNVFKDLKKLSDFIGSVIEIRAVEFQETTLKNRDNSNVVVAIMTTDLGLIRTSNTVILNILKIWSLRNIFPKKVLVSKEHSRNGFGYIVFSKPVEQKKLNK